MVNIRRMSIPVFHARLQRKAGRYDSWMRYYRCQRARAAGQGEGGFPTPSSMSKRYGPVSAIPCSGSASTHRTPGPSMRRQRWMRRFDFDRRRPSACAGGVVPALNLPAPVKYLKASEVESSHFHYWRDNAVLTWMHGRLLFGWVLRMPWLLARRLRGRPNRRPSDQQDIGENRETAHGQAVTVKAQPGQQRFPVGPGPAVKSRKAMPPPPRHP